MSGDVLASRGENKKDQVIKNNALSDTKVYTGGKAQEIMKRFSPSQIAIFAIVFLIAYKALKK